MHDLGRASVPVTFSCILTNTAVKAGVTGGQPRRTGLGKVFARNKPAIKRLNPRKQNMRILFCRYSVYTGTSHLLDSLILQGGSFLAKSLK
jgi:hypothetical protein